MTGYIYEQDLNPMKFNILTCPRQDRVVRLLAEEYGISLQVIRKVLLGKLDMMLLENLPARYEAWSPENVEDDVLFNSIKPTLLSVAIPIIPESEMDRIMDNARQAVAGGLTPKDAVEKARKEIREVILA